MKPGLHGIIFGVFFLALNTIYYLRDPSSYFIPFTFAFLTVIMTGVFEFKEYYNKKPYLAVIIVLLALMWMVGFIQPLSLDVNTFFYYLEVGLITLLILAVALNSLRKWGKMKRRWNSDGDDGGRFGHMID